MAKKKSNTGLILGIAATGLVVLGGGAGALFLLSKKGDQNETNAARAQADAVARIAEAKAREAEAAADNAKHQAKLADREWWEVGFGNLTKGVGDWIGGGGFNTIF